MFTMATRYDYIIVFEENGKNILLAINNLVMFIFRQKDTVYIQAREKLKHLIIHILIKIW